MILSGEQITVKRVSLRIKASYQSVNTELRRLRDEGIVPRSVRTHEERPSRPGDRARILRAIAELTSEGVTLSNAEITRRARINRNRGVRAITDLRESGEFTAPILIGGAPEGSPFKPRVVDGHPEKPRHHELRMIFHQTRHELGGEPVPRAIREKYVPPLPRWGSRMLARNAMEAMS
jgi:hypothetical protein